MVFILPVPGLCFPKSGAKARFIKILNPLGDFDWSYFELFANWIELVFS